MEATVRRPRREPSPARPTSAAWRPRWTPSARPLSSSARLWPHRQWPGTPRRSKSTGCGGERRTATATEAHQWVASAIVDRAHGMWVDPRAGKVLLNDFAHEWMDGRAGLAPKTVELYHYLIENLILPGLGDVELADVTPAVVRSWRA